MKKTFKLIVSTIAICTLLLSYSCKNTAKNKSIAGKYESIGDTDDQKIEYTITHIKDNIYGIKVDASFDGTETQTDYLEGSFNAKEKILSTKRSNVILNYRFSDNFNTVELIGDENDITLERR